MARSAALAALTLVISPVTAFFLMPCWPIMTERLDPIVNPGELSGHVHQIAGGDGFAPVMDYNTTQAASCTTCFVKGDKSNYWIPALYYQHQNGSFERVPQVGSASMYYFNEKSRLGSGEIMESFPEGLHILAGDTTKRTAGTDAASLAINYKCLDYSGVPTDSKTFPTKNCPNGVRAEVTYPSCWDGKNLDSADHKSHMAYPTGTFESGSCPSSHPHHLVTLKVEFIFDTNAFKDMWYGSSQPFLLSSGDTTGYGLHADYVMGWENGLLDLAVDQCFDIYGVLANCAPFNGRLPATKDTFANPGTCTLTSVVDEDVGGMVANLPGCDAPGSSSKAAGCKDNAKLMGKWAVAGAAAAANVVSELTSIASVSTKPTSVVSIASTTAPIASSGAFYADSGSGSSISSAVLSPILASSPTSTKAPVAASSSNPVAVSAVSPNTPSQVASTASSASPSPAVSSSFPPSPHVSSAANVKIVTVTDIATEIDYFTQTAKYTKTVAFPAGGAPWTAWKRDIGDSGHRHQHRHGRLHARHQ